MGDLFLVVVVSHACNSLGREMGWREGGGTPMNINQFRSCKKDSFSLRLKKHPKLFVQSGGKGSWEDFDHVALFNPFR